MKAEILNRKKKLLATFTEKAEADWAKQLTNISDADKLTSDEIGIHKYFHTSKKGSTPTISTTTNPGFFGQSLEVFKTVFEMQKQKFQGLGLPDLDHIHNSYDVLITIVGFSLQPLMHTILTINPGCIVPIVTKDTAYFHGNIPIKAYFEFLITQYGTGNPIEVKAPAVVDKIGSFDTFQKIRQIIQEAGSEKSVAIDITGGKKSMDASAFLTAAVQTDVHIFYVDFEGYEKNKAQCGTEFLNKLDNPYQLYNIREEELIKEFWERKDYDRVERIVSKVLEDFGEEKAEKYGLSEKREIFLQIQKAAKCYAAWSNFNYELAQQHTAFDFYRENQQNVLSDLMPCPDKRKTAKGVIYLAADRWMRGSDFLEKNELHKAALCFTQVIEVLSEYRLWQLCDIEKAEPKFEFGETHFDVSKIVKFLFKGESFETKKGEEKKFLWKTEELFPKKAKPSSDGLISALGTRNKLAHFNCFSENATRENENKVKALQETSKKYIELFITTYSHEMGTETFDNIKNKLGFAPYEKVF